MNPLIPARRWIPRAVNGLGGLEPVLDLCGLSFPKKIRVRIAILRDRQTPLGMTATPSAAKGPLDELQHLLWTEARVTLAGGHDRIRVLRDTPPDSALRVRRSSDGSGRADDYFRSHLRDARGSVFGYAEPVTVFLAHEVAADPDGCHCATSAGYVVLERARIERGSRMLAHGIAHACGLRHVGDETNLMFPRRHGRELRRRQKTILRNSPHVTHF